MQTVCTIPKENVFECKSEEQTKDWNLTEKFEFSRLGIINTKTFHDTTDDIATKKYYEVIYFIFDFIFNY